MVSECRAGGHGRVWISGTNGSSCTEMDSGAKARTSKFLAISDRANSVRRIRSRPVKRSSDILPNSAAETDGGALGASLLFGELGYTGISYQRYNSDYGTVAEEEVTIHLR